MEIKEIQCRLGENIKALRKARHLTQAQLSEMAEISEDTIKSVEQGRAWPEEKTLANITKALDVDVYHLFLPVGISFNNNSTEALKIKESIADNVRSYIDTVLKNVLSC